MRKQLILCLLFVCLAGCAAGEGAVPTPTPTFEPPLTPTPSIQPYTLPPEPEAPTYLPQALVELWQGRVAEGTERDYLEPERAGRTLTEEEIIALLAREDLPKGFWGDVTPYLREGDFVDCKFMEADGDNDGILDILVLTTDGSAGFSEMTFYRGLPDGGYEKTYNGPGFVTRTWADFEDYEGSTYLLEGTYNFYTKVPYGVALYGFQDGVLVENVRISRYVARYTELERQGDAAEKLIQVALQHFGGEEYYYPEQWTGSAEEETEDGYLSDLNNDGVTERYQKSRWYPSNFMTVMALHYEYKSEGKDLIRPLLASIDEAWTPQVFWVGKTNTGNLVCIASTDGEDRLRADAWYLRDGGAEHAASVRFTPEYEVETWIETQGVNMDFIDRYAMF